MRKLKHFSVDKKRHSLVVETEFYQMNLSGILDVARKSDPELFMEDGIFLPSWSKFAADPIKGKGFFIHMLQAMFEGKHSCDDLNVDYQTRNKNKGLKVEMAFLPGSTKNENILDIEKIAQSAVQGWAVKAISGASGMTNASSERSVKEFIEVSHRNGMNVLLLSAGMAQRSFSIGEITAIYLMYDTGDNGATIQKMSRTLTPHNNDKVGRIFSLSFDPNRDDKFDAIIIETAQNFKKNKNISDIKEALRQVLKTVDIFNCTEDGKVKVEIDHYLEEAIARKSIDRVIGKVADFSSLSSDQIKSIAEGNAETFNKSKQEKSPMGKTHKDPLKKERSEKEVKVNEDYIKKAREVIVTIAENIDVIRYQYPSLNIDEAFSVIDSYPSSEHDRIKTLFGLEYNFLKTLITSGIINRDLIDLKF